MRPPRIVLQRPQSGENIGCIVRLCANFGIQELCLVSPSRDWREAAARPASMCREQLARVQVVASLDLALADRTHVFGFSARAGRDRPVLPLRELATTLPGGAARVALLFGNEESGLAAEEIVPCSALYRIEAPGLSSFNLSHAVALALWECSRPRAAPDEAGERDEARRRWTVEDRRRIAARARTVLQSLGYRTHDPHFEGALERLVIGGALEARDGRILDRVLTHLAWVRENGVPGT